MFKKILICLMFSVLLCSGCSGCRDTRSNGNNTEPNKETPAIATNAEVPERTLSPDEQNVEYLKEKLALAEKKAAEAAVKGDIVARLTAEKEALMLRTRIAESYAKQWEANAKAYTAQVESKDIELKNAKLDAWKEKLWWMAGICGFLGIVAGGVAFGFPLLRPLATKAALILASISIIMLIVAQCITTIAWILGLVPYILGFGLLVALIIGIIALRHWWLDHNGLKQTIEGIEPLKEEIDGFGDHMLKYVDDPMVNHVKNIRGKLGLKKPVDQEKEDLKKELALLKSKNN
jgi:hypothetical protein